MPRQLKPVACPGCKSTDFDVCGYVFYRQPFYGETREYGTSTMVWEADYPEYVECHGCKRELTAYFKKRGILGAFFEVHGRASMRPRKRD